MTVAVFLGIAAISGLYWWNDPALLNKFVARVEAIVGQSQSVENPAGTTGFGGLTAFANRIDAALADSEFAENFAASQSGDGVKDYRARAEEVRARSEVTQNVTRARSFNGFDVSNASIPHQDIHAGGPPRDGIPALTNPAFTEAQRVDYLEPDDLVIGLVRDGVAKAYPLRILAWHEIANDTIAGQHVAVTYCPLCGTAMVFDRQVGDRTLAFGVSGLLYQSDVLMYDRETESLWSQLKTEAVSGPLIGQKLDWIPSEHMSWAAWQQAHPESLVLSTETGHRRDYSGNAYAAYMQSDRVMFPVPQHRDELGNKVWVLGVFVDGTPKAYPLRVLKQLGEESLEDSVTGVSLRITYDTDGSRPEVRRTDTDSPIPYTYSYWFAWQAFYPETLLYSAE